MAATAGAQAAPRGTLDGLVTDSSLAPLGGAAAWLLGTKLEISTGDNGRFRITNIPAGTYVVVVRRLGYAPLSSAVSIAAGDTTRASFTLLPREVTLGPVVVTSAAGIGPLAEFESRRTLGLGQYMTQDDIRRLNMARTSDLLRTFHSTTVTPSGVHNSRGLPARGCNYQFYLDGVAISVHDIDVDLPPPMDLAGMEVYTNTATVPLQYASVGGGTGGRGGGFCGVILVWMRR
ncbi:MAG TPA: carboxypeptidase-like regulatory domain-containing protein [Gemmatimonadaceae bacterium]|nr:carboxypeptidase-like regulatory domain-containing protein [Gemmatimonadaceae bacterium]